MLLLEDTSVAALATALGDRAGAVERFAGEDGTRGGLAISEGPVEAGGVRVHEVAPRFVLGRCASNAGAFLFCVGVRVPEAYRDEFLAWYECEHAPILLQCPVWIGCRFVEETVADGAQFYALHELLDRSGLDSAERRRSRSTPWFERLAQQPWFDGPFDRRLYRRIMVPEYVSS